MAKAPPRRLLRVRGVPRKNPAKGTAGLRSWQAVGFQRAPCEASSVLLAILKTHERAGLSHGGLFPDGLF
jgi:hypothetical protein